MLGFPSLLSHRSPQLLLLLEGKKRRARARERETEGGKKSLPDPEIIAHTSTYEECSLSGGQIVVWSWSGGKTPERWKRAAVRRTRNRSTAGERGSAVERLGTRPVQTGSTHTHTLSWNEAEESYVRVRTDPAPPPQPTPKQQAHLCFRATQLLTCSFVLMLQWRALRTERILDSDPPQSENKGTPSTEETIWGVFILQVKPTEGGGASRYRRTSFVSQLFGEKKMKLKQIDTRQIFSLMSEHNPDGHKPA